MFVFTISILKNFGWCPVLLLYVVNRHEQILHVLQYFTITISLLVDSRKSLFLLYEFNFVDVRYVETFTGFKYNAEVPFLCSQL